MAVTFDIKKGDQTPGKITAKSTTGAPGRRKKPKAKAEDAGTAQSQQTPGEVDRFEMYYATAAGDDSPTALRPPYNPDQLIYQVENSNAVSPCIDVMEANIPGTGWSLMPYDADATPPDGADKTKERIETFFSEVWPRVSLTEARRQMRRDEETTGNTYLEVIRNNGNEIVALRPMNSSNTRLVALDDPVQRKVTLGSGEYARTVTMSVRERRYMQVASSGKKVYFREYGSSRELDKDTGKWQTSKPPVGKRATEVLHFGINSRGDDPYFVPRWIGQVPSVVGSRKAEEQNLSFFNSGGVPPLAIFIKGGTGAEDLTSAIRQFMSGTARETNRALVVHVDGGGTLEKENSVSVDVEKFGDTVQDDAQFQEYDANNEKRVRRSFRLPGLFLGMADSYSFANAVAAYTVTEAQVFDPERDREDEVFNSTIMRELDPDQYWRLRSSPLTIKDMANHLKGLGLAKALGVQPEALIEELNDLYGMDLPVNELGPMTQPPAVGGGEGDPGRGSLPENPSAGGQSPAPSEDVQEVARALGKRCAAVVMDATNGKPGVAQEMAKIDAERRALCAKHPDLEGVYLEAFRKVFKADDDGRGGMTIIARAAG